MSREYALMGPLYRNTVSWASISGPRRLPSMLSATATTAHDPSSPLDTSGKKFSPSGGNVLSLKTLRGPRRMRPTHSASAVALVRYRRTHSLVQKPQAGPSLHAARCARTSASSSALGGLKFGCLDLASTVRSALWKAVRTLASRLRRGALGSAACRRRPEGEASFMGLSQEHIAGTATGAHDLQLRTLLLGGFTLVAPGGISCPLLASSFAPSTSFCSTLSCHTTSSFASTSSFSSSFRGTGTGGGFS
mmetsp:Transcript_22115/g.48535  ORF Transcript_22115/g.48535 Transcript_22115/m.48535 type:complete len:249 (-) Transcript_22115:503-1249(-)